MDLKIVFMGSPDFAIPTLRKLAEQYTVVGVVTQPSRPAGRGRVLTPPPVKLLADSLGIETIQPERLREPFAQERLQAWAPDLMVVAAFGQILRKRVLELPRLGCINVHASLLPRWRGAAPIQAAIMAGDEATGVTIMQMDPGIDTGAILSQERILIRPDDTADTLSERLAQVGANLLLQTLPAYLNGQITPQPQDDAVSTYAPMLTKEAGLLDFQQSAQALERQVRALNPWPGAYLAWGDGFLKVHQAHVAAHQAVPGQKLILAGQPAVAAQSDCLILDVVQPAGKKPMPGAVFLNGARTWDTD